MAERIDKILISFYDDEILDSVLLDILNNTTTKRNRANKVKDILIEYYRSNMPGEFDKAKRKIEKGIDNNIRDIKSRNQGKKVVNLADKATDGWDEE